ncbi:MAG: phosphoribosylformylglycinamidine synthase subunit PurQ [Actinomycetota bacterium]|nr:phosphoribosylformylglycinamidine synthase subunit PurQ [Actinomycetota bacterium]
MSVKVGVIVFPGTNCDQDVIHVVRVLRAETQYIWHLEEDLSGVDAVVLPGGFAYGDYLRTGAMAAFSPVMSAVKDFAAGGGLVIGICNGFQILCEAGLLPGALRRNTGLKFRCMPVKIRVETVDSPFSRGTWPGEVLNIPINHFEGNYYCSPECLAELEIERRVLFRYCDAEGEATDASNPNGSAANIAGILSEKRNVLGMMPHPERAVDPEVGGTDGRIVFTSMLSTLVGSD